jgi:hypothetical protein
MFTTNFANALLINDADTGTITAEDSLGEINPFFLWRRNLGSRNLQLDPAPMAEETLPKSFGAARRTKAPAQWLSTMGAFHRGKLLLKGNRGSKGISTTFCPIVQCPRAQRWGQSPKEALLSYRADH